MARKNFLLLFFLMLFTQFLQAATSEFAFETLLHATDDCCIGITGNIDADINDQIDISDIVYFVSYSFANGPAPQCFHEADLDASGNLDIADIVYLVAYSFSNGSPPKKCPSLIYIENLQSGDQVVNGLALVSDTNRYKVVLWAKTNQWYVQPSIAEPFTYIQHDSTWSNNTYPWDRMLALLVDTNYQPGSIRDYHPSLDSGVIAWDEFPNASIRYINWSNYNWYVKTGNLVGPGPNYFSDDTLNVAIDAQQRLHLNINYHNSQWNCAEIVLDHSLGYGYYTFQLDSRVDNLDYNTILGCFIYETTNKEFDFEFSQRLANPYNAQYVVQPWYTEGNIEFFNMPLNSQTSHSFEWREDSILFKSWFGHADSSTTSTLIHSWIYTGDDIPVPGGERMIFNLYLYGGEEPISGSGDETIIKSFDYKE